MKKILALLLVAAMVLTMAACGGSASSGTTAGGDTDTPAAADGPTPGVIPDYAPQNWSDYDDLIASIKSETDLDKRVALMHQAEDMMMETYAVVPIYYYNDIYMMKSNVTGMYANVFGYKFFQAVTKEGDDATTLRLNLASEPDYLDPALNSSVDGACLAVNSFCGLLTYDDNGNVIPDIAESYEVSDDGLVYTFHLRQSNWSDGTPLTVQDFVYSWNRAANPMTASDYSYLYDGLIEFNPVATETDADGSYTEAAVAAQEANEILLGIETPDDYTMIVNLVAPCPFFTSLCAFPTFFPVHQASVEAANTDGTNPGAWCQEAGFVSNGPFLCTAWSHDESMTYTKNPEYWNADTVALDTLQFMLSADDTAIFGAYNAGDLDFIDTIPTDEIGNLNGVSDEFYIIPNLGTYYVGFNVNSTLFMGKTPEQANAMRKAISLLIDRDYIVETVAQSGQELACTFIPTGMSDGNGGEFRTNTSAYTYPVQSAVGYFDPSPDAYDDNLEEALELLEFAGFVIEDGKLSAETPLSFTYLINTGTGHQKIAESMQQDLAAVGIEMSIEAEDWNVFLDDRKAGKFDVAREGWLADYDDPINMLEMWTTSSGNNDMQFGRPF